MRLVPLLTSLDDSGLHRSLSDALCLHTPRCPAADSTDREAAAIVASHPEQGWNLLCNGLLLFDDTGELLPDGQTIAPHRPAPPADYAFTRYRHPLVAGSEPGPFDTLKVLLLPATGREEEPLLPGEAWTDPLVSREDRLRLSTEYRAARTWWGRARFRLHVLPLLRQAAPLWQDWTCARDTLFAAFEALRASSDGHWQAALLRLTETEQAARTAADRFDAVAADIAQLAHQQVRATGEDEDTPWWQVAKEIGLDATDWPIAWHDNYHRAPCRWGDRLVDRLQRQIEAQREQLREMQDLADSLRKHPSQQHAAH